MKIVTLNVSGFRGMAENGSKVTNSEWRSNLKELKALIDSLEIDEESIVILQEIPHQMLVNRSMWQWEETKMFHSFQELFEADYEIFYPRYLICSKQCTVALGRKHTKWRYAPKGIIQYNRKHDYGNKLVELEKDGVTLLGVHVSPYDDMWNMLLDSLDKNSVTYIAGDFNANEKRGAMKHKPQQLREKGYCSLIPCNVITDIRDQTSLDNLYVCADNLLTDGIKTEICHTGPFVTDHMMCIFEINPKRA